MTRYCIVFLCFIATACHQQSKTDPSGDHDLTRFVDPFIGTGFHGHVFLGASVPFGAVQLGPVNISKGWDWCSGYHYSDSTIKGFSHTHLSGTGIGDLGDIALMPATGNISLADYHSSFSHDQEKASPGYYAVYLKKYGIQAELTSTERVGLQQYHFPASEDAKIIIDLEQGIGWDAPVETHIEQLNDSTIAGYRFSKGWAVDQRIYFASVFSKPVTSVVFYDSTSVVSGDSLKGKKMKAVIQFATKKDEIVSVKTGVSPVSMGNAVMNIAAELPHWDFNTIASQAKAAWNKELNKIRVKSDDTARLRTFYSALYHTMIAPSVFNDHNGDYMGTDKKVYTKASFTNYTTFSLWDTYRAAHPLLTLLQSQRVNDMVSSMLAIYQQQGKLPVWHLMGNETNTMPGYSGVLVVADAYLKGFRGFDTALAWQAVKATAMQDERGLYYVKKYGFIPADSMVESVALGMEYSIADGAIAKMADQLGSKEDQQYFKNRAINYRRYFDPAVGFVRGKPSEDKWREPFSPFVSRHMKDDFSEGNAWQYTWLAPHDVNGLIELLGGSAPFLNKLDSLFVAKGDMGKEASNDITGLIGQYAHGNEPSHHIPYLYAFAGQPWKTAEKVRYILNNLYSDKTDGLCGNEDVGQMSAWYILSALGLYQVDPAGGIYVFGSPVMDEAKLTLGNGKELHFVIKNNNNQNIYIQNITLNENPYPNSWIHFKELMKGGTIVIEMGPQPSATWGRSAGTWPYSTINK